MVLLYHRVVALGTAPQWLSVPPTLFEQQVDMLKRNYKILPLPVLVACVRQDCLPRRSVTITFDDGYADNHLHAKPILEKHEAPATIFVSSGFVGRREEFFWDELDRLLLQPGRLPRHLNLSPPDDRPTLASPM